VIVPFDADFVDRLVADFRIPDRGRLIDALAGAYDAYQEETFLGKGSDWADDEAKTLDALAKNDGPLWTTVELIRRHPYPIARQLAGDHGTRAFFGDETKALNALAKEEDDLANARIALLGRLYELADQLAEVGRAAEAAPRRRLEKGEKKRDLENEAIWRAAEVLAAYWTADLGRKMRHSRWYKDEKGKAPTPGGSAEFCYRVIENIARGRGGKLDTILREFTPRVK
jgi:hypothetical protein